MPIMSTNGTTNPPTATTQQKTANDIKQTLGICLPSNSTTSNIIPTAASTSTQSSTCTTNNTLNLTSSTKNVTNTNNFYTTTSTAAGQFPMTSMSQVCLHVAKLDPTRQQTVILQPRITNTRGGATLQIQNAHRGSSANSQNISTSFASTTSSISVRTRVISGQTNHTGQPLQFLTSSFNATTNSVKQVIAGQKFIAGNMETVNVVMACPSEVRNLKTNATNNEIKSLYKIGPKQLTGSTLVTPTQKMISLNSNSGQPRLGILGNSGNNKSALINLPKNFIITPTASGIANMVSLSGANFSANRIQNQIIARQTVTTTISQPTIPSTKPMIYTVNSNANMLNPNIITTLQPIMSSSNQNAVTSSVVSISAGSISTPSTISNSTKPSIQTINNNNISPIKSTTAGFTSQQQTPSSPRPRILSRKRPSDIPQQQQTTATITIKPPTINTSSTNGPLAFVTNNQTVSTTTTTEQPNQNEYKPQSTMTIVDHQQQSLPKNEIPNNIDVNCLTPRKKPRKQLLEPSSPRNKTFANCDNSNKMMIPVNNFDHQQQPQQQSAYWDIDVPKEKLVFVKKPRPSLINSNTSNYIKKFQHFSKYSEVKSKHDKKLTIPDLLNDIRKRNEWKDYSLSEQCKKLADEELFTLKSLEKFLDSLEKEMSPFSKCAEVTTLNDDSINMKKVSPIDRKCVRINDIIRANIQRSKVFCEQLNECSLAIKKLTHEHHQKVTNLTVKLTNKRSYSK